MAVVLRSPSGSMAVLLLLAAAAVLSNAPSSALANSSLPEASESDQTTTATEYGASSSSSGGDEQQQTPPPPSSSKKAKKDDDDDDDDKKEQEQDPETKKQKEKERQKAREKAVEEEKAAQKERQKYAEKKHLVSPTNGTGWYKGIAREFVQAHNALRARYGVPPMKWDRKLARLARRWSNAMRKDCQLKHSGGKGFGQSVFRSHDNWNATATDCVNYWAKEEAIYDKQRERCLYGKAYKECGHFALMVGKRSTRVGCARAECYEAGVFITCNYTATDLKKDKKDKDNKDKDDD